MKIRSEEERVLFCGGFFVIINRPSFIARVVWAEIWAYETKKVRALVPNFGLMLAVLGWIGPQPNIIIMDYLCNSLLWLS